MLYLVESLLFLNISSEFQSNSVVLPNTSDIAISLSEYYINSGPIFNACTNSQIGNLKIDASYVTLNNNTLEMNTFNVIYILESGTLTFLFNSLNTPLLSFFEPGKTIKLNFLYGTGLFENIKVEYASLLPLGNIEKTRIITSEYN